MLHIDDHGSLTATMLHEVTMTDSPNTNEESPEATMTPNPAPSTPGDIPEDTEYDFTNNNDENRSPLPPHIAARFYKPATNRRKSSAASSRRNSISSAHSHQSHLSNLSSRAYSRSDQSNHVAQHLRRASILETRKARLADRAAHAEKVRLRAALNKAAPRGGAKDSEERALAAQQARERNLKEIVASCAAEVERAKGVAASQRERRVKEGEQLRRDMEERAAEAERRREEMLNRGQGKRGRTGSMARDAPSRPNKSLSPMMEVVEPMSEETAARRIQSRWRIYQKWRALEDFSQLSLTIAKMRDSSFEDATAVIASQAVLLSTAKMLRICGLKEGEIGSVDEMTAVRTFLAAFLILGHPAQVLSTKEGNGGQEQVGIALPSGIPMRRDDLTNPQLQELVAKAGSLIVCFENILSRLMSYNNYTPPPAQLGPLSEAYAGFYNSFIAWKARDTNAILDMMVLQFVELDAIWMKVKDSTEEAVTASYRDGIRENQLKLMVRIKRLAGAAEGKRLIGKAIQESRKAKTPPAKRTGDVKPRAALEASPSRSLQTMRASHAAAEEVVDQHLEPLMTPPATPTRLPLQSQPPHSSQAEHLRTFGSLLPDNRTVIHELAMSKEYRIAMDDCLARRGVVNSHIFESMRREIAGGNIDPWILAMAENIRTKLQKLLKSGGAYYRLIGDMLDPEIISQELNHGSFSFEKFFSGMANILPKLCAPFRDEEAKDLVDNKLQNGDFVTRLEALMHFIDIMQLDYANYMLQESVPQLLRHAVSYEQKAFQDGLNEGRHGLGETERWWNGARRKVLEETMRRDPEGVNLTRTRPTPDKFYSQMLVDVTTDFAAEHEEIPETFQLDHKRINRMKADMLRIVCAGAILLQAKNLMKRDVRSQWKTEASRIISVLEGSKSAEAAKEGIQAALESCRNMPMATKSELRIFVGSVVENTYEVAAQNEGGAIRQPVMRILMTRLRTHILGRISAQTSSEKVKATSTASEGLAGLGLPEFVASVGKIVDEIQRMGAVDRETHGIWYEAIEKKAMEAAAGGASA